MMLNRSFLCSGLLGSGLFLLLFLLPGASFRTIPSKVIKCGFYSGTFDPPTKAHNTIIRTAIDALKLDKIYIYVNKNNHKDCKCSTKERVEMLKLMLNDIQDKIVIIPQVSDQKSDNYLIINNKSFNQELILIAGEDSYKKRLLILPQDRMKVDAICIIPRGGKDANLLEPNAFYLPFTTELGAVSSTKVRQQLSKKNYKKIDLTMDVLNHIIKNHFYNFENKEAKKIRYIERFCRYVGKLKASCLPPDFDPTSSEDSWQEKFHKYLVEHNIVISHGCIKGSATYV